MRKVSQLYIVSRSKLSQGRACGRVPPRIKKFTPDRRRGLGVTVYRAVHPHKSSSHSFLAVTLATTGLLYHLNDQYRLVRFIRVLSETLQPCES